MSNQKLKYSLIFKPDIVYSEWEKQKTLKKPRNKIQAWPEPSSRNLNIKYCEIVVALTFHGADSLSAISNPLQVTHKLFFISQNIWYSLPGRDCGNTIPVLPQTPDKEAPLNCAHLSLSSGCCLRTALNQHIYQMLGPASFGSCTICLSPHDGIDLVGCLQLPWDPLHRPYTAGNGNILGLCQENTRN